MPDREHRRLTTILAADVAGYSRLMGADEEGTMRRLRALRAELIDPAIQTGRGRIFKTTGDGILVEFASVVDAVRCAIEVQHGMDARNADVAPDKRIEFRVGIHLGDVIVESDGDLMGDGVNIVARLEGIAAPGGIFLSRAAFDQVEGKVDAVFADLGDQELKNIARPVRVFAIDPIAGAPSRHPQTASPLVSPSSPPRLSIVVLPFANLGGDPEQEYFADGFQRVGAGPGIVDDRLRRIDLDLCRQHSFVSARVMFSRRISRSTMAPNWRSRSGSVTFASFSPSEGVSCCRGRPRGCRGCLRPRPPRRWCRRFPNSWSRRGPADTARFPRRD
jgi:class 3 adenylate cyclase